MKKVVLFFILVFLINSVSAMELQGGVKYTVDSARAYVQEAQLDKSEISGPFKFEAQNTDRVVYSYNNAGEVVGITVQYKGEPEKAYIYGRDKTLIYLDKYDAPTNIYPHRGYRYDLSGNLVLTSLTVSKDELFRFAPDGKLLVHSIKGIMYDENGEVIGRAK